MSNLTGAESRALELLGNGVVPVAVASAVGLTESRISQLLSDPEFAAQVADLRYQSLQKHNARDTEYDQLEDDLIVRLKDCLPLMHRPMEILKAIQVINAAKRRGASTPESITQKQTVINLVLPVQLVQRFSTTIANSDNQILKAGDQELLTIQSGTLLSRVQNKEQANGQLTEITVANL